MKKLFAQVSYSYNNFYNNLNERGQMIFSIIIFLIAVLCVALFISYVIQGIKNRKRIKELLSKNKLIKDKTSYNTKEEKVIETKKDDINTYQEDKTEIQDIADSIERALKEDTPISLTNFEEDQEKTAIISIDELYAKAKELEMMEDEETGVNYLEKYNLEASEVEEIINETVKKEDSTPIKSFKVSQVISPVYGVKKEVINSDKY